jgi:predicted DNA-binding transcriptional regulator AlpA
MKSHKQQVSNYIPETGFLRLPQITGQRAVSEEEAYQNRLDAELEEKSGLKSNKKPKRAREAIAPIIPISRSQWWAGVQNGRYPKPIKMGPRITAWKASDIQALVEQLNNGGGEA